MNKKLVKRGALAVALLIVLGVAFFVHFFLLRTMGEGPAGPAVSQEAFATVWSERPVTFIGLGDSITTGYGASPGYSYFERLVSNPADEFEDMQGRSLSQVYPNLTAHNISVNATTSIDHARNQIPQLEKQSDDTLGVVVMTTGGNDLIHMYGRVPPAEGAMYGAVLEEAYPWINNYEIRLHGMMENINKNFPGGCHIFLANIYDPSDGVGSFAPVLLPEWPDGLKILKEYNDVIARCAEKYDYVHLVNIHDPLLGHGLYCRQFWNENYDSGDPHYWYFANLEDPNDRGYDAIRRIMLNKMVEVLAPDKKGIAFTLDNQTVFLNEIILSEEQRLHKAKRRGHAPNSPGHIESIWHSEWYNLKEAIKRCAVKIECDKNGISVSDDEITEHFKQSFELYDGLWKNSQRLNVRDSLMYDTLKLVKSGVLTEDNAFEIALKDEGINKSHWHQYKRQYLSRSFIPEPLVREKPTLLTFDSASPEAIKYARSSLLTKKFEKHIENSLSELYIINQTKAIKGKPFGCIIDDSPEGLKRKVYTIHTERTKALTYLKALDRIEWGEMDEEQRDEIIENLRNRWEGRIKG